MLSLDLCKYVVLVVTTMCAAVAMELFANITQKWKCGQNLKNLTPFYNWKQ